MDRIYAFDIDGTLTDPRRPISPEFDQFFRSFAQQNLVYLVTGSDRGKIEEQLPSETIAACYAMFTCSGAELWANDRLIYRKEHAFAENLIDAIEHLIDSSQYPHRLGNHVEHRPGMINMTTVGRNATNEQRQAYFQWDQQSGERKHFVEVLTRDFPDYDFLAGGEISIDIVPKGWTKAVAKEEIEARHNNCRITFYGDRMDVGGNDKPLADVLLIEDQHACVPVHSYRDTWLSLESLSLGRAA